MALDQEIIPSHQSQPISRRRFLKIVGATSLATLQFPSLASASALEWRGPVIGTEGQITLLPANKINGEAVLQLCKTEILRLEKIFSLYIPNSSISQLNKSGFLKSPPSELVALLEKSQYLSELSKGVFDASIQPLWRYLYSLGESPPSMDRLKELLDLVNYQNIQISSDEIIFKKSSMEITLNGIAQGFITDKISELLRAHGFNNILVELGETFASGVNQNNNSWRIGIKSPGEEKLSKIIELTNAALATSGGYGTLFSQDGLRHHLINARTGQSANRYRSISVVAPTATLADGLSTVLYLMDPSDTQRILRKFPGAYIAETLRC